MTKYDIDLNSAANVVSKAGKAAEDYDRDGENLDSTLNTANGALKRSPAVLMAFGQFCSEIAKPDLKSIQGHTRSALLGTSTALKQYQQGDHEMLTQAEHNAAKAHYPKDAPGAKGHGS